MGIIFSRFRKKKTTLELLQKLEDQIKEIEEYSSNTEQKYKKIVGQLLVYSLGLYVLLGVFCYFYFPTSLRQKLLYFMLLVLSPVILYFVKRFISWYYVRKINTNQSKLAEMKQEKKRLLEEVMDKETYKVAKDILEKFAPENLARKIQPLAAVKSISIQNTPLLPSQEGLRRRSTINPDGESLRPALPPNLMATPRNSIPQSEPQSALVNKPGPGMLSLPLPAPVLPRERSYLDRVVEYLIGDGPANRYALICSQCHSHNGMALKEEFEYIAFRCCYCFTFNPAKKQRPEAPKLPTEKNGEPIDSESDNDSSVVSSGESNPEGDRSDSEDTRGALDITSGATKDIDSEEADMTILQKENYETSQSTENTPRKNFSFLGDDNACFSPVIYNKSVKDTRATVFTSNIIGEEKNPSEEGKEENENEMNENLVETELKNLGDTIALNSTSSNIELIDISKEDTNMENMNQNKDVEVDNKDLSNSEVLET